MSRQKNSLCDESQPEQLAGDKQSLGEASLYEKRRQRLIETNRYESYVKAAAERKRKSRSERNKCCWRRGE